MASLSDPLSSQVLLIGSARHARLHDLPAVHANLVGMRSALADTAVWGLPTENCRTLYQADNPQVVIDALHRSGVAARDTFIVYFSGHALIPDGDRELYLALAGSGREDAYHTALPYSLLRKEIRAARAQRKVVIIDCLLSDSGDWQAIRSSGQFGDLEIEGAYILLSASHDQASFAQKKARSTDFSGALLATLNNGISGGPPLLDLDTLASAVLERRGRREMHHIRLLKLGSASETAFARNVCMTRTQQDPQPVAPDDAIVPAMTNFAPPQSRWKTKRMGALAGLAVWLAGAALTAIEQRQLWWLALAIAAALLGFADWRFGKALNLSLGQSFGIVVLPTVAVYVTWASVGAGGWQFQLGAVGAFAAYVWTYLWARMWYASRRRYRLEFQSFKRKQEIAEVARASRWIVQAEGWQEDRASSDHEFGLADDLDEIPAARLYGVRGGQPPLIVVAGTRVLLVSFSDGMKANDVHRADVSLSAPEFEEMTDAAERWRFVLRTTSADVQPMIVVRKNLREMEVMKSIMGISEVMVEDDYTFPGSAKRFLAPGAYVLDMAVLERIRTYLEVIQPDDRLRTLFEAGVSSPWDW